MTGEIRKLPAARRDMVDVFAHFARDGRLAAARRFLQRAEATFERLASLPLMGARYAPEDAEFAELRYLPISRFKSWLVFYRPIPGGIEVVRVLHGARDLPTLLADDLGFPREEEDDLDG